MTLKNLNITDQLTKSLQKNVILDDKQNKNKIFSNKITYFKDEEKFITDGNSIAKSLENNIQIDAEKFEYHRSINKIIAKKCHFG